MWEKIDNIPLGKATNKATGYIASITKETKKKLKHPSPQQRLFDKHYILNLNSAVNLYDLFENAVYIDTKQNQKSKKQNEFHHFVAPLYMNDNSYRVRIVAKESPKTKMLYIVETEVFPIKNGTPVNQQNANRFLGVPSNISVLDLVDGVNIYNYASDETRTYSVNDVFLPLKDSQGNELTKEQVEFFKSC